MFFSKTFASLSAVALGLGLADYCQAAVQCGVIDSANCGINNYKHKLPTSVGSTYYVDGFHGGTIYAKFQSVQPSIAGDPDLVDLTYNFNLGTYSGQYWIILPTGFGDGTECYGVIGNCDVTIRFWDKTQPFPNQYSLA